MVQPDGPEIETFDTKFHIRGIVDIDVFPRLWHDPTERRISKTYPVAYENGENNLCHVVTNHNAIGYEEAMTEGDIITETNGPFNRPNGYLTRSNVSPNGANAPPNGPNGYPNELLNGPDTSSNGSNGPPNVLSGPNGPPNQAGGPQRIQGQYAYNEITFAPGLESAVIDIEEEDEIVPQLFAILWLNSQAFVVGQQVTCDVKIENFTRHPVECVLKLEQVSLIQGLFQIPFVIYSQ